MYQVSDQSGRRFVVTGANSGTGKEAARRLASAGAHVVMAVRNEEKGHSAAADIRRDVPGASLEIRRIDLADMASVRSFAAGLLDDGMPDRCVDQQCRSDGGAAADDDGRRFRASVRQQFPGPVWAHQPVASATAGGRETACRNDVQRHRQFRADPLPRSAIRQRLSARDGLRAVETGRHADGHASGQGGRRPRWNLLSTIAHPGYTRTNLQTTGPNLGRAKPRKAFRGDFTLLPSQDVVQGTEPLLFAATDPAAEQGAYYGPSRIGLVGPTKKVALPRTSRGIDLASSLWSVAEALTGTSLPAAHEITASR